MSVCFECGGSDEVQEHHVVPQSLGGTKTVPLCTWCHGKVHGMDGQKRLQHRNLTIEGLQRAKSAGVKLGSSRPGSWQLSREAARKGGRKSARARAAQASKAYMEICPLVLQLRTEGLSLRQIANRLTAEGHKTRTGKAWNQVQVSRVLEFYTPDNQQEQIAA